MLISHRFCGVHLSLCASPSDRQTRLRRLRDLLLKRWEPFQLCYLALLFSSTLQSWPSGWSAVTLIVMLLVLTEDHCRLDWMIQDCSIVREFEWYTVASDCWAVRCWRNTSLEISYCCLYTRVCSPCCWRINRSFGWLDWSESVLAYVYSATIKSREIDSKFHQSDLAVWTTVITLGNFNSGLTDLRRTHSSSGWVDRSGKIATDSRSDCCSSSSVALRAHVADSHAVRFAA